MSPGTLWFWNSNKTEGLAFFHIIFRDLQMFCQGRRWLGEHDSCLKLFQGLSCRRWKGLDFFERPQGLHARPIINSFNKYFWVHAICHALFWAIARQLRGKLPKNPCLLGIYILMKRDYPEINEPSGKELHRSSVQASYELIRQCPVTVAWENLLLLIRFYFGSWFLRLGPKSVGFITMGLR